MKRDVALLIAFSVVIALVATYAATVQAEVILAKGLLKKVSSSILVWDAVTGKWVTQKVSYAEETFVTENNQTPITITLSSNEYGNFTNISGTMLLSDKVYVGFMGDLMEKGTRADGNCHVSVVMVTDGNLELDGGGKVVSGAGTSHLLSFEAGAVAKATGKDDGSGNIKGIIKFTTAPYNCTYTTYTGGTAESDVAAAVKASIAPIPFESYSLVP